MGNLKDFKQLKSYMKNQVFDKDLLNYKKQLYPEEDIGVQKGFDQYFFYILDWETQKYSFVGNTFKEITGFEKNILEKGIDAFLELIHSDDTSAVQRMMFRWIRFIKGKSEKEINRYSASLDFRIRKKNGDFINVLQQSLCLRLDKKGNIVYETGMITDISHLKDNANLLMHITGPGGKRILEFNPRSIFENSINGIKKAENSNHLFRNKINKVINERYYDSEFGIQDLSREMNMSRYQLHRKTLKETGFPPNALIRFFRLKKAVNLLNRKELNISQIAYKVGFSSPTYFSKCFSEEFGCSPRYFREDPEKL